MMQGSVAGPTNKNRLVLVAVAVLFLLLALAAGFFFWKWIQEKSKSDDSENVSQRVIKAVGNIYEIPRDEEPTVAIIQDKDMLKEQIFFDGAQNGDYMLVYKKKRIGLIYREEIKKLINVAPIAMDSASQGQVSGAETTQ